MLLELRDAGLLYIVRDDGLGYAYDDPEVQCCLLSDLRALYHGETDRWTVEQLTPEAAREVLDKGTVVAFYDGSRYWLAPEAAGRAGRDVLRAAVASDCPGDWLGD
jgi:hypothetical protein